MNMQTTDISINFSLIVASSFYETDEFRFTTCNKQGPFGPTETDCERVYKLHKTSKHVEIGDNHSDDDAKVDDGNDDDMSEMHDVVDGDLDSRAFQFGYTTGIQRWKVPRTGIYT